MLVEEEELCVFLDETPSIPLEVNGIFGRACDVKVQGRRRNQARMHHKT
jgi:hypothetical protein